MTSTQLQHALILRTNGEFEITDWPKDNHLAILYRAIDCTHVDAVDITPNLTMWIDDTGLIDGKPINLSATILYALHNEPHQHYHGNVVLTGGTDPEGETLGLSKNEIARLVEHHLMFTGGARIPQQPTRNQ